MTNEMLNTDLYEVLGVAPDVDDAELAKAYKRLARELHPDVNPGDPAAEERFKQVSGAYDVLGDAEKRAEYDEFRSMIGSGGFDGTSFGGADFGAGGEQVFVGDFADLLGGLFGGHAGAGGFDGRFPRQGHDVEAQLALSFDEAVRGTTRTMTLAGRPVTARIPVGVRDGQRIRLAGKGTPGMDGGPAGDLFLELAVGTHPVFARKGRDLTVEAPVPYATAVLGGTVTVATYDGGPVTLKVAPGTPSGRVLRAKGKGVEGSDLLVTLVIEVPTELSGEQRAAVEALADAFERS